MLKKKSLEINSLIVFLISMVSNFITYIFQMVISRLVSNVEGYGTINTLLSLYAVLSVPSALMTLAAARYAVNDKAGKDQGAVFAYLLKITKNCVIGLLVAGVISAKTVSRLLGLRNPFYMILLTVAVAILLIGSLFVGILQGKQSFWHFSMQGMINVLVRFIFSVLFVLLGLEVYGVMFAILLGCLISFFYVFYYAYKDISLDNVNKLDCSKKKEIHHYLFGITCIQLASSILSNGDLFIIKIFYDGNIAGLYSSAMVFGKIPLYISGAVISASFPLVADKAAQKQSSTPVLIKLILYGGGCAVLSSIMINLLGRRMLGIFFDKRYLESASFIYAVTLYIIPFVFLNIIVNFFCAMGRTKFVSGLLIICCLLVFAAAKLFHFSIEKMMIAVGIVLIFGFVISLIYYYCRERGQAYG